MQRPVSFPLITFSSQKISRTYWKLFGIKFYEVWLNWCRKMEMKGMGNKGNKCFYQWKITNEHISKRSYHSFSLLNCHSVANNTGVKGEGWWWVERKWQSDTKLFRHEWVQTGTHRDKQVQPNGQTERGRQTGRQVDMAISYYYLIYLLLVTLLNRHSLPKLTVLKNRLYILLQIIPDKFSCWISIHTSHTIHHTIPS